MSLSKQKYHKDAEFTDPVVRCDSCAKIVRGSEVRRLGMCPLCGNRRVRSLQVFNDEEHAQMVAWNIDPEYLEIFSPVEEEGNSDV